MIEHTDAEFFFRPKRRTDLCGKSEERLGENVVLAGKRRQKGFLLSLSLSTQGRREERERRNRMAALLSSKPGIFPL